METPGYDINEDFLAFVAEHSDDDIRKLWLQHWDRNRRPELTQIEAVQKARNKIPTFARKSHFLFPNVVVAEQCTNEWVAQFHASLFDGARRVLDLTAGLAIDSYYIGRKADEVVALEIDETTALVDAINMTTLGADNVRVYRAEAIEWLAKNGDERFDAVYADPARRGDACRRVYALDECSPALSKVLPLLRGRAQYIIVKASPMLDVAYVVNNIENVSHIWAVSFRGECKEILFRIELTDTPIDDVVISAVGIGTEGVEWSIDYKWSERAAHNDCGNVAEGDLLYVPDAAIVKAGACAALLHRYPALRQLHPATLLFSLKPEAERPVEGRLFTVDMVFTVKEAERWGRTRKQANVAVRNFPLTAAQLRAKLKVTDGGDTYAVGCRVADGSLRVIIGHKPAM